MGGYSNSCSDQSNYLDIFKASLTALCKPQAGLEARKFVTRYFHSELGVVHSAGDYVSCCVRHPCWLLISSEVVLPIYWDHHHHHPWTGTIKSLEGTLVLLNLEKRAPRCSPIHQQERMAPWINLAGTTCSHCPFCLGDDFVLRCVELSPRLKQGYLLLEQMRRHPADACSLLNPKRTKCIQAW